MKIINSSAEVIPMNDPLIHIEKIGRVCYKSNSTFTQDTAQKFFNSLVNSGHHSVLEHATFIFLLDSKNEVEQVVEFIRNKRYIECTRALLDTHHNPYGRVIVSGNLRAIKESGFRFLMTPLIQKYQRLSTYFDYPLNSRDFSKEPFKLITRNEFLALNPTQFELGHHLYTTILFTTDRGVTHEMVRHRPASFSQESTRYCNYSQDKFGNELTFICPATFDEWTQEQQDIYCNSLSIAEKHYLELVAQQGLRPQFARGILPTDVKTQIAMTANHNEWQHFFNLRLFGTTGNPHPNMKRVAEIAYKKYKEFNNIL